MKGTIYACVIATVLVSGSFAQNRQLPGVQSIELFSSFVEDASGKTTWNQQRYARSCLDLVSLKYGCANAVSVGYGARSGVNRDLITVNGGKIDRTKMVRIGKHSWNDKFSVPYIEPWSALALGERRHIVFNVSGGDGADGEPGRPGIAGMNGDGTFTPMPAALPAPKLTPAKPKRKDYGSADVTEQVSSKIVGKDGQTRVDGYTPVKKIIKDHIYAIRVIDELRDYYILIRVDEVSTGDRIEISFLKLDITEDQ